MTYELFRLLHLAAIVCLVGAVVIENIAIKAVINQEDIRNLAKVDRVAGMAAILTLGFGLVLWLGIGKPAEFYTANPVFHAKLGLFLVLILSAIYPSVYFLKHRNTESTELLVPKSIRVLLKVELVLLFTIPVLAFLMTRGIGLG